MTCLVTTELRVYGGISKTAGKNSSNAPKNAILQVGTAIVHETKKCVVYSRQ